jgi:hypothetical protein
MINSVQGGSGGGGQVTGAAVVAHGGGVGGQVIGAAVVAHGGGVGGHVGGWVVVVLSLHSQLPLLSAAARLNPAAATMSKKKKAALPWMKDMMADEMGWRQVLVVVSPRYELM